MYLNTEFESFSALINKCWAQHEQDPQYVASLLETVLSNESESDHLVAAMGCFVHTCVAHLREAQRAQRLFDRRDGVFDTSTMSIWRGVLLYFTEPERLLSYLASRPNDEQALIRGRIANELVALAQMEEAILFLQQAASFAAPSQVVLHRILAIASNNLACQLEEQAQRTEQEKHAMLWAARQALDSWKIAGGWKEEERAEYRFAKSYLAAGDASSALGHATRCLNICQREKDDFELFYAYELLAHVYYHLAEERKHGLDSELAQYCEYRWM
ncbi:hypothetical protein [Vibrio vulnificus]|uniref:hypothetical protein n=1 Tax=Vibrio vulnificus TaxID=672 RepID=UPI0009B6EF0A|nr:hypothetical protein [Vibrio vulnificus]OQK48354.1 hypothetical protein XM76_c21432 [Vibrio vulnificus]